MPDEARRLRSEPRRPGSSQACHQQKLPSPSSGTTRPTGPLVITPSPQATPTAAALRADIRTGPFRQPMPSPSGTLAARTKSHSAKVVQNASGASGVAARPETPVQRQVAITRPDHSPTSGRKMAPAISPVSRQDPMVSRADASRAPVSLTPATAKPARWSQLTSTGFSTRSLPLNVGTTQSPEACIASEQAALRGSSSSQRGEPPRFGSSTSAATRATASADDRVIGMTMSRSGATGRNRDGAVPRRSGTGREGRGAAQSGSSRQPGSGSAGFSAIQAG